MVANKSSAMTMARNGGGPTSSTAPGRAWSRAVYEILRDADIKQVAYVPDAGHAELIDLFNDDPDIASIVLTSEEEGIAIAAGAWLGGQRSVLLMQSSGAGNCINMAALATVGRFPLVMLVTMRGEWAEFNPWQIPMGQATESALTSIGVLVLRPDGPEDLIETVGSAVAMAYDSDQQIAILISQRMLGEKKW